MALRRWRRPAVLALLLAAVATAATFADPRLLMRTPTYRYVFVFDISQSMNAEDANYDGKPGSRLEVAKRTTLEALMTLPCGTEAGLALFTGHRAFLLLTPIEICAHYRELRAVLQGISWRMAWEQRSEVAKGLYKSLALVAQLPRHTRLVFISDGHEAPPIDPEVPPRFTGRAGAVRGLVVGVGGDSPVSIPKFDESGARQGEWSAQDFADRAADWPHTAPPSEVANAHLSALKEPHLTALASQTGLAYLRLQDAAALAAQLRHDRLAIPRSEAVDVRAAFAALALVALLLSLLAQRGARR